MVRGNPPLARIFGQYHQKACAQGAIGPYLNARRPCVTAKYAHIYIDNRNVRAEEAKLPNRQC